MHKVLTSLFSVILLESVQSARILTFENGLMHNGVGGGSSIIHLNSTQLAQLFKTPVPERLNITTKSSTPCECGRLNEQKRIVGGNDAREGKYPAMCMLFTPINHHGGFAVCGTGLIDKWNSLTAAHCVKGRTGNPILFCGVYKRDWDSLNRGTRIEVEKVHMHPRYDNPQFDNDIAVLNLAREAPCTRDISPLCMPSNGNAEGKTCLACGWGSQGDSKNTDNLQEMTTRVQYPSQCRLTGNYNPQTMLCLDKPSSGKSLCSGDSGGPIMCKNPNGKYALTGVNNFVLDNCEYPNASARVYHFRNWINGRKKKDAD